MPEHEIRFRAGWILAGLDETGERTREVISLPVDWANFPARGGVVRIVRSFQRPPIDPEAESIGLRIADAPGVVALRLNDSPIAFEPTALEADFDCALEPLAARRNVLEMEVDLAEASRLRSWGKVSLLIRREV